MAENTNPYLQPGRLQEDANQASAEYKNSYAVQGKAGAGEFVLHSVRVANDSNSWGGAAAFNWAKDLVSEHTSNTTVDPKFREQLSPEFYNKNAADIPLSQRKDFLDAANNWNDFYRRLAILRERNNASQELAQSPAAQRASLVGNGAELTATALAGGVVMKGVTRAGAAPSFAQRLAVTVPVNTLPNQGLEIAKSQMTGESRSYTDAATGAVIDGTLGGGLDALAKPEMAKLAAAFSPAGVWTKRGLDKAADLARRMAGKGKATEAIGEEAATVAKAEAEAVTPAVEATPVPSASPAPDFNAGIKSNAAQVEAARIDGRLQDNGGLLGEALHGTETAQAIEATGARGDDALKTAFSEPHLDETLKAIRQHGRLADGVKGAADTSRLEGAVEARLGLKDMEDGWLFKGTDEEAIAKARGAKGVSTTERVIEHADVPKVADDIAEQTPDELTMHNPIYSVDGRKYRPVFDSDVDKALYVVGHGALAKVTEVAMDYLKKVFPHMSETSLQALGRDAVIATVRGAAEALTPAERASMKETVKLRIPNVYKDNLPVVGETKPIEFKQGLRPKAMAATGTALVGVGALGLATNAEASTGGAAGGAGAALASGAAIAAGVITRGKAGKAAAKALKNAAKATVDQAAKAEAEWKAGGFRDMGLLRADVATPAGYVTAAESGEVFATKVRLKVPGTEKSWSVRLGFTPADTVSLSKSQTARASGDVMFDNPVGKKMAGEKGSSLVDMTADARSGQLQAAFMGKVQERAQKGLDDWLTEKGLHPDQAGNKLQGLIKGQANDFNMELAQQFNGEWARAMRGGPTSSPAMRALVDDVQGLVKKTQDEIKLLEKRLGTSAHSGSLLREAAAIDHDVTHLTRVHSREARTFWRGEIGDQGVIDVYAAAIRSKNTAMTAEDAEKVARDFVHKMDAIQEAKATPIDSGKGSLRELQSRVDLDELHTPIQVKGLDGEMRTVSIQDLFDNDPTRLLHSWGKTMHGIQGLAEAGERLGVDLTSTEGWNLFKKQMLAEGAADKEIKLLDSGRDFILGRGGNDIWRENSKELNALLQVLSVRYGKNFVFAQFADMANQIPQGRLNRIMDSLPMYADIKKDPTNTLWRDVANVTGLGLDHIKPNLSQMVENGTAGKMYRNISLVQHKVMKANGFYEVMDNIKGLAANLQLYKLADAAKGLSEIPASEWKHLRRRGIDPAIFEELKPLLAKHARYEDDIMKGIDFDAMRAANPQATARLETMLYRVMKDAASEASGIGQTIPFMTTSLGRLLGQFQQAAIVAHQRLRGDILNFDKQMAIRWGCSFMAGSMSYMARTAIATMGDPESFKKRMEPHKVLANGFKMSSFAGFLPSAISTASMFTPWGNPLDPDDSTGRVTVGAPPVFGAAQNLAQSAKDVARTGFTDHEMTRKQFKRTMENVNPFWWMQPVTSGMSGLFPDVDPVKNPPKPKQ